MRKATFDGPGKPLKLQESAVPKAPVEGALIRTIYSGVCHSDVHLRQGSMDLGDGVIVYPYKIFGEVYNTMVFGHEISGMVMAFGENADPGPQNLKVGDNVIVYPWVGCEKCEICKAGLNNRCEKPADIGCMPMKPGGYATHVPVPELRYLIKVPDSIPMSIACMLPCSGATTYSSLLKVKPRVDQAIKERGSANLLIIGAGGLGLWCIQLVKKGVFEGKNVRLFVADISEDKFPIAIEAGADEGIVWDRNGSVEETAAKTTKGGERKMDAVINLVGSPKTSSVAIKSLYNGGILVVIGLAGGSLNVPLPPLVLSSKVITGGKTSSLHELIQLVDIVSKKGLNYTSLSFAPLEGLNQALDELKAGTMKGRTILKFD